MTDVTCCVCGETLRKDQALMDAEWEQFIIKKNKEVFMCRECAKMVAYAVVGEY